MRALELTLLLPEDNVSRSDNVIQIISYHFKKKIAEFGFEYEFTPPSLLN